MHYSKPARAWLVCNKEQFLGQPGGGTQGSGGPGGGAGESSFEGSTFLTHARDEIKACTIHEIDGSGSLEVHACS